jgi:hypothetical protein
MTLPSNHEFIKNFFYKLGACFTSKTLHEPHPMPNVFKLNQKAKT